MKDSKQILIVGQGLAGTILSSYCFKNDIQHKVLDNNHFAAATHAAAGLINPITGRAYVKSWMIEDLIAEAKLCYKYLENLLSIKLLNESVILRSLNTSEQINKWNESTGREGYDSFLDEDLQEFDYNSVLNASNRFGVIKQAFQVDVNQLINVYKVFLRERHMLISDLFNFDLLNSDDGGWTYENEHYSRIIFCEGFQICNNRYFKNLPMQPAKGESLEIEIKNFSTQQILRDEIFLVPLQSGRFWSGGTYLWQYEDHLPSDSWKTEWKSKLQHLIRSDFEIHQHRAGIRPCVKGRKPLIGEHKVQKGLFVFNGLGTKGTSLSPFWAKHLIEDHLINKQSINPLVNIDRFEY